MKDESERVSAAAAFSAASFTAGGSLTETGSDFGFLEGGLPIISH